MKRPETREAAERRTLALGGADATERLPEPRLALGRYRLDRRLGAGGFGVVWLAWDEKLEREVALKAIPRERGGSERVEREARAAARLNHPGIVAIYELATDEHDVYLVSELVRGRTLGELERAGAISDRDVARIGAALCDALEHAHARGVIHRDVKPQNVMVVAEPAAGAGFAKLADFGVAHMASSDVLTRTGEVVGTLAYMAPEQAEGARVTPASDVYSLALTLYEAWTGANPIRAGGPAATARRLGRPLPPLAASRGDLPLALCDAVDAALEVDQQRRPTPRDLRAVLVAAEPELADAGGLVEPATLRRVGLPTTRLEGSRHGLLGRRAETGARRPVTARLLPRAGAGVAAAGLALGSVAALGGDAPPEALTIVAVVGLGTALLPRLAWLAAALLLCGWLASPEVGLSGSALLVVAAVLSVPLLLPRWGVAWSLPALAPLLGTVALAPVFAGVAALAPSAWRRAGLAAAGGAWLLLAEVLTGERLLFGPPAEALSRQAWEGSLTAAAESALAPLGASPTLLLVPVLAAFAAALPLVVRGRWVAADVIGAAAWAAALVAALVAIGDAAGGGSALEAPRGALAGAVGAALVALSASRLAPPEEEWRGEPVTTG